MSHIPSIRPLQPSRRIDQYAMSVRPSRRNDVYPKWLELYTDPNDPSPGIDESQPSSSSDGGVTDNAETGNGVPTYQNHKDSDVYVETVKDQSASYHGSTESNNLSLKHNTQETSVESGPCVYRWSPQEWLMHPSLYCKYMERYLSMPLDDDFATIVSSYGGTYLSTRALVRELTLNVKVIEEVIKTFSFLLEIKDGTKFIRHRRSGQRWNSFDDELITTSKFATNSKWRCAEL
ncbi:hypothetical protein K1719_005632 [Acacia pycnantha]|nr:hypothetical protein K1719_005632 [Acacia pycnantha]